MRRSCLLFCAALLGSCSTEPQLPPPPLAGKIVFASDRVDPGNGGRMYTMNPDGSSIVQVPIQLPPPLSDPDVSPDGDRLAFRRDGLYSVRANGSDLRHLTTDGGAGHPGWSPDGQWLAFSSGRSGSYDLWVMDAFGNNLRQVTATPDVDEFLGGWSPDSSRLVYMREPPDGSQPSDVWSIKLDGTGAMQLTHDTADSFSPAWSPDGSQIVYVRAPGDLRVMNRDGSDDHSILNLETVSFLEPDWSPDGAEIAFGYNISGIGIVRADGTGLRVVADSGEFVGYPAWGPARR